MSILERVAANRQAALDRQAADAEQAVNDAWATYALAVSGGTVSEKRLAAAVELLNIPPEQVAADVDLVKRAVESQHRISQMPQFQEHARVARIRLQEAEEALDVAKRNYSACRCRVSSLPACSNKIAESERLRRELFRRLDLRALAAKLPADPPASANPRSRCAVPFKFASSAPLPTMEDEPEPEPEPVAKDQQETLVANVDQPPAIEPRVVANRKPDDVGEVAFNT